MPLLGQAAMLLSFDVAEEAIAEHDDWHTHEHLPERLSIPGFLRGTRWVALRGKPRYFVLYEVESLATLTSDAYLQRLNNPSPWTAKMMKHYRGMTRGFCSVTGSFGVGLGAFSVLLRFKPAAASLLSVLPDLVSKPGIAGAHLLEGAATPAMTNEQRIRGTDAGVDCALVVNGYDPEALERLLQTDVGRPHLERHGAAGVLEATYRIDYSLAAVDVPASGKVAR
jgi:hypothetical protein